MTTGACSPPHLTCLGLCSMAAWKLNGPICAMVWILVFRIGLHTNHKMSCRALASDLRYSVILLYDTTRELWFVVFCRGYFFSLLHDWENARYMLYKFCYTMNQINIYRLLWLWQTYFRLFNWVPIVMLTTICRKYRREPLRNSSNYTRCYVLPTRK